MSSSYCGIDTIIKLSKALGIEFKYDPEGSLVRESQFEDVTLYNDEEHCKLFYHYYCQPLPCDAEINLQYDWCDSSQPVIGIFDQDDVLLAESYGIPTYGNSSTNCTTASNLLTNQLFTTNLSGWTNGILSGDSWSWNNGAYASLIQPNTQNLKQNYSFANNKLYTVDYLLTVKGGLYFEVWLGNGETELFKKISTVTIPFIFTNTLQGSFDFLSDDTYDSISIVVYGNEEFTSFARINEFSLSRLDCITNAPVLYYTNLLTFGGLDCFCDKCITLKLYKESDRTFNEVSVSTAVTPTACNDVTLNVLEPCKLYRLSFDFTGTDPDPAVSVRDTNFSGELIASFNGYGSKTLDFYAISDTVYISIDVGDCNDSLVSNILLKEIEAVISNVQAISEPLCVSDNIGCLTEITYWNDSEFDDIDYSQGFRNKLYLPIVRKSPNFPEESKEYMDSKGRTIKLSGRVMKEQTFQIDYMPEYMHQKLSLALAHDNVEIGGIMYTKKDYSIDYQENQTVYPGTLTMIKTVYNYVNSNC
jgi:hypothetical protein